MNENSNLIVGGYYFGTEEDAEIARQEEKKIEYLEQHMDYGKAENMLLVYRKAIESRVFRTPIGWDYLKKLQGKLEEQEELSEPVPPVTLSAVFAHRVGDEIKVPASRLPEKKKNTLKGRFVISVLVNVMLAVAVGAMFYIALTSSQPNILNYEKTLVNKYAVWEQELSERESALRDRERELMAEE